MEKNELTQEQLNSILGGYPDGEFKEGEETYCPLCGCMSLELIEEKVVNDPSSAINRLLPDKTYRTYECPMCKHHIVRYGDFYDFV